LNPNRQRHHQRVAEVADIGGETAQKYAVRIETPTPPATAHSHVLVSRRQ
jgi:hypothetical protein